MKMSKRTIILAISVTLTLSVIIASFLIVNAVNKVNNPLVLIAENGVVELKKGNKTITVYDNIMLDVLPPSDREKLVHGIIIENEEQLYSIIEDYDG